MESRGMSIIRSNDTSILFRAALFDASGNPITTAANLNILHFVPASGDIETYDFNDDTFKTGAVTTFDQAMTHEQANNNTVDTGIQRHRHATLTDFEVGHKYVARITHASLPAPIIAEFQYGDLEGDEATQIPDVVWDEAASGHTTSGSMGEIMDFLTRLGQSFVLTPIETAQAGTSSTIQLDASHTEADDFFNGVMVAIVGGVGAGQVRAITDYVQSTDTATVKPNWVVTPDNTSQYVLISNVVTGIVDEIWDENVVAAHALSQSAGLLLNVLGGAIAARSFNATLNDLLGVPDTAATDTAVGQVWEELLASHNTANTMGETMNTITTGGAPSAVSIADAVWDEDIVAAHGTADTAGLLLRVLGAIISQRSNNATLDALLGVPDVAGANLPDAIMDEDIVAAHSTADTLGFIIRQLGAGIAQRSNNNSLNALLNVPDTAVTDTVPFRVWDEVLDAAHVIADSAAERVKAVDDLTQAGGAGDLADTNSQVQKLDLAAVSGTPAANSIADKLDDIDATLTVLDRDLLASINLEGVDLRIEVAVEQFGVIQTSPWVDAAAQIYDEANGIVHNIGIADFGAIGPRGFFTFTQTNHTLVAGNTYQIAVQVTDGASLSISTTKPFKVFQG